MTFREYLAARNETQRAFSIRTGIGYRTVHRLFAEGVCGPATAIKVVRASHSGPTPRGEVLVLEDLLQSKSVAA